MKKIVVIMILTLLSVSCSEKKTEFVQSAVYKNLYLVKNMPEESTLGKKCIEDFVTKNALKEDAEFYNYSNNTKYFLDHKEDPGGFSSEEISRYQDKEGIASLGFVKCEKDSLKKAGIVRYYNWKYGDFYRPDTIIKCSR